MAGWQKNEEICGKKKKEKKADCIHCLLFVCVCVCVCYIGHFRQKRTGLSQHTTAHKHNKCAGQCVAFSLQLFPCYFRVPDTLTTIRYPYSTVGVMQKCERTDSSSVT